MEGGTIPIDSSLSQLIVVPLSLLTPGDGPSLPYCIRDTVSRMGQTWQIRKGDVSIDSGSALRRTLKGKKGLLGAELSVSNIDSGSLALIPSTPAASKGAGQSSPSSSDVPCTPTTSPGGISNAV
jgi:hypothetical protein